MAVVPHMPQYRNADLVQMSLPQHGARLYYRRPDNVIPGLWLYHVPSAEISSAIGVDPPSQQVIALIDQWLREIYGTVESRKPTNDFVAEWGVADPL